jgi:hypothetical protein
MVHPPRPPRSSSSPRGTKTDAVISIHAAVKSLLLVVFAGLALAVGNAAPAGAATPCWRTLINDWFDGQIDQTYPRSCYTQAIQHLPRDVKQYSSAKDDIERALLALIRGDHNNGRPNGPGSSNPTGNPGGNATAGGGGGDSETPSKGVVLRAIEWLGPSDAASVPLPLLVLAGVAFLLLAAAGGSFVNRRLQERRLPPH